jgi:hypothetical protein
MQDRPHIPDDLEPDIPEPAKVPFEIRPEKPMFRKGGSHPFRRWPPAGMPGLPGEGSDSEYGFPTHLGMPGTALGAVIASLKSLNATGM